MSTSCSIYRYKYNQNVQDYHTYTVNNCYKLCIACHNHHCKEEWEVPQYTHRRQQGDAQARNKMCPVTGPRRTQRQSHEDKGKKQMTAVLQGTGQTTETTDRL